MIRIIQGVYGHYMTDPETGKSRVVAKDKDSEPFALTEEQESRLVGQGVAEYVCELAPAHVQEVGEEITGHLDPEQLRELTNAKLTELAEEMGIDTKKLTTKAKLIEAITSAEIVPGEDEDEDDGEDAPTFDAAEAVE